MFNLLRSIGLFCIVSFIILLSLHVQPAFATGPADPVNAVLCNVINFVKNLGLPIMTGVIIGSSVLAIFGRLAWPAIVMLVVFTAIFFGASKIIPKFATGLSVGGTTVDANTDVCPSVTPTAAPPA